MALLDVENLSVHYGPVAALRGVTISIDAGEMVALLGPNGAGKTTTLRSIAGQAPPSDGDMRFDGTSIGKLPAHEVVHLGIALGPEGRQLFPTLTVEENLRYGFYAAKRRGERFSERCDHVYEIFPRLAERRGQAAGTMSGGEQQMLVVGRALMSSPKLLMVDELSLGLAPLIVSQLFDVLEEVNAHGMAVLIVEQFVDMALKHTSRAYVLNKGRVAISGRSSELREQPELLRSYLGEA